MPTTKFNPGSELVVTTFIRNLFSDTESFGVANSFPEELKAIANGFIQVQVVGGSSDIDVPERRPLVQVDCYVPAINSSKPKWARAATIAEDLVQFVYEHGESTGIVVPLGPSYKDALVQTMYIASEPRRVNGDPAGHARFTFDIVVNWIVAE